MIIEAFKEDIKKASSKEEIDTIMSAVALLDMLSGGDIHPENLVKVAEASIERYDELGIPLTKELEELKGMIQVTKLLEDMAKASSPSINAILSSIEAAKSEADVDEVMNEVSSLLGIVYSPEEFSIVGIAALDKLESLGVKVDPEVVAAAAKVGGLLKSL